MQLLDIDHVQIAAPKGCESEARRFFGQWLGMDEVIKPERLRSRGGCWFQVGPRQLHIGVEEDFRPAKKAHVAFTASDIDALFARLSAAAFNASGTMPSTASAASMRMTLGEVGWSLLILTANNHAIDPLACGHPSRTMKGRRTVGPTA
jgi:hypothetical protein